MTPTLPQSPEADVPRAPSLTYFDRKIALGFGALVLVLMIIVSLVASHTYQRVARSNEDVLITALTGILADSVNRTSFSGRYHMRLLVEQVTAKLPQLSYVYVANPEGDIIAHSDPAMNASPVPEHIRSDLETVIASDRSAIRDREEAGLPLKEIVMPYRAGYENRISGVIVAGISLQNVSAPTVQTWAVMASLIALLTALSLLATYFMSKRFAGPVKQLAWILHGILEHTPVYIGIFRPDGTLAESSANYRELAAGSTLRHRSGDSTEVYEWNFERGDEPRVAMATTFPISRKEDGTIDLFCSIAADITGRRRAEAALREHRDLLEATVRQRTQALEEANAALSLRESRAVQLSQLKEFLLRDAPFAEKLRHIADCAVAVLDVAFCQIWVAARGDRCDGDCQHEMSSPAPVHCLDKERCLHLAASAAKTGHASTSAHERIPLGYQRVGRLATGPDARDVANDFADAPDSDQPAWIAKYGLTSFGGHRLASSRGELAGILAIFGTRPILPEDEAVLDDLSTAAAHVIQAKLAADELEAANRTLVQHERLATLGELTATVSHELRNPLGTIQASFFLLKNRLQDSADERIASALERAARGIHRCDRIIEALLDFTRDTVLHREWTQLDAWLNAEIAGYDFPASIAVRVACDEGLRANVDRQVLYQCLTNVLNNACDAILEDGESGADKPSTITISLRESAGAVLLSVEDSGAGISRENLDLIFKPLFSTKGFGTGLGLPLVRKLIELHGGRIDVTSRLGVGTVVRLTLPLDLAATPAPQHTPL
jgi:signal transduction histidine kinase